MPATDADCRPRLRYADMIPMPGMTGDLTDMAMYAGQSAGLIHQTVPAGRIVTEVAAQDTSIMGPLHT